METDTQRRPWWQYPARVWSVDPLFWREVTARALASVIAASVVYVAALLLGYVRTPSGAVWADLALLLATFVLMLLFFGAMLVTAAQTSLGSTSDEAMVEQRERHMKRRSRLFLLMYGAFIVWCLVNGRLGMLT